LKKYFTYQLILLLTIVINANLCLAQNTIDEIESYIFSQIFNSKDKIKEFIEFNEENDTIRYWHFNENGSLNKEFDFGESSWSSSIDGQTTNISTTYKKEFNYNYYSNGKIKSIYEIKNIDNEISTTMHEFSYPHKDTIIEFYKIDINDCKILEYIMTKTLEDSDPKEIIMVMKNYVGNSFTETIQRIDYEYAKNKMLKLKIHYFKINSYFKNSEPEITAETLGAKTFYNYDKFERLEGINEIEFTEEGLTELRMDIKFSYKKNTNKIKRIDVIYGANYTPKVVKYDIHYKLNGDIRSIKINEKCFNYVTRK
jgi:hypothetical protein